MLDASWSLNALHSRLLRVQSFCMSFQQHWLLLGCNDASLHDDHAAIVRPARTQSCSLQFGHAQITWSASRAAANLSSTYLPTERQLMMRYHMMMAVPSSILLSQQMKHHQQLDKLQIQMHQQRSWSCTLAVSARPQQYAREQS